MSNFTFERLKEDSTKIKGKIKFFWKELERLNFNWNIFFQKIKSQEIQKFVYYGHSSKIEPMPETNKCWKHSIEGLNNIFFKNFSLKIDILSEENFQLEYEQEEFKFLLSYCFSLIFPEMDNLQKVLTESKEISELKNLSAKSITDSNYKEWSHDSQDSEKRIFVEGYHYGAIPIELKRSVKKYKYIGPKHSGDLHGPDWIFYLNNGKAVGFEIFEFFKNIYTLSKFNTIKIEKSFGKIQKQVEKKFGTLEKQIIELNKLVESKINKWLKYQSTDLKYLAIIMNSDTPDYIYFVYDKFLKLKFKDNFNKIILS